MVVKIQEKVKKFTLLIFVFLILMSFIYKDNKYSFSAKKTDNISFGKRDSLPYEKYWEIVNDSLEYSQTKENNEISLDTSIKFKTIIGHFTSFDKYECLLQRTFHTLKGGRFDFACIFSYENNSWKFENLFNEDSIMLIDIDKDSIFEFFYFEDWVGNGSIDREYRLESMKNNKKKILYEDIDNHDNRNNYCAFSISKIGDTVFYWRKYYFEDKYKTKPLILKSTLSYGIKKGETKVNGEDKLIIFYSEKRKDFVFDGEEYR